MKSVRSGVCHAALIGRCPIIAHRHTMKCMPINYTATQPTGCRALFPGMCISYKRYTLIAVLELTRLWPSGP